MDKILIVEDETIVALEIKRSVEKLGFFVTNTVTNFNDALKSVNVNEPNIILMDINLKNSKDGIEIAHAVREIKNIPIIYLTAYSDDKTIKRAVETDPLGYMIKPFKREELKSVLALAQYKIASSNEPQKHNYTNIGYGYFYDTKYQNLYFNNKELKIGKKEKLLLDKLVHSKGIFIPFKQLEYDLYPDRGISESTLRTLIYRLRSKLDHKLIETKETFGCRLIKF